MSYDRTFQQAERQTEKTTLYTGCPTKMTFGEQFKMLPKRIIINILWHPYYIKIDFYVKYI